MRHCHCHCHCQCNLSPPIFFFFFMAMALCFFTEARDLRPSQHGLLYQKPAEASPAIIAFFSSNSSSGSVPLPQARDGNHSSNLNSSETMGTGFPVRDYEGVMDRKDRVRAALLVVGLFCGVVGVILLLTTAVVFFVRQRSRGMIQNAG